MDLSSLRGLQGQLANLCDSDISVITRRKAIHNFKQKWILQGFYDESLSTHRMQLLVNHLTFGFYATAMIL
ncbi:hypothetical protein [Helicobacter sp. MIT 05-5294]|uniref:hypothetical protein n=1 Tax=Helicobacter sp. MIT 05-5294 TaxID=1548150 RepID=UPI0010FDC534|nr:hypothetical protein [Helicobacter sp. MIT 05-5294]TLD89193.1 hypothetical protein LS69_000745 [Helicobacter sp. MIT 05-5294]